MFNSETAFFYFGIGLAIFLLYGILKYIIREKLAAQVSQNPEAKKRILGNERMLIPLLRIMIWLSPIYLILFPLLLSKYSGLNGLTIFACMTLMVANVFLEYRFRKWLYQYLLKPDQT